MRRRSAVIPALFLPVVLDSALAAPLEIYSDGKSGQIYAIRVTPPVLDSNAPPVAPTSATIKATADAFREVCGLAQGLLIQGRGIL